jgi:putative ABC transport system permease protein
MIFFLIKGLIRDRSRSLFPILIVMAGVFLTVTLYSTIKGAIGDMVDSTARFDTGHIKVMTRAYSELSDQVPNDLALLGVDSLLNQLRRQYPHMTWTPRVKFGGLLDIPDQDGETRTQGPVLGMGIDLLNRNSPEFSILRLDRAVVHGTLPKEKNDILISEILAEKLGVSIGETATLITSTMHGSMSIYNFKVAGTIRFGMTILDRGTIITDIEDIRVALDMPDGASEIVGFEKDMIYSDDSADKAASALNNQYSNPDDAFSPVFLTLGDQGGIKAILDMANSLGMIMVVVFIMVMSIVLWNTGLMNGIRRYGEIGIRLAMGEPKSELYRFMILESFCIGIAGSIIGTLFGLAVSYWMQYVGFDFGSMMQKSTLMISTVFRAKVTATSYYIGFFPGVFASVIGTMFAGIGIYRRQTSQLFKELEV